MKDRSKHLTGLNHLVTLQKSHTGYATDKDPSLKPYHWYKQYVVAGAKEHLLSPEYIAGLEKVESVNDPNRAREARERAFLLGN